MDESKNLIAVNEVAPPEDDPVYAAIWADLSLKPSDRRFVEHYVRTGNRKEAFALSEGRTVAEAEAAHSPNIPLTHHAYQKMQRQDIQTAVARLQAYYSARIGIQTDRILGALATEAFFDPAAIYEPGTWTMLPVESWPLEIRQCLKRVRTRTTTNKEGTTWVDVEVEFSDRQRAKEILGDHLGLWNKPKTSGGYTLIIQPQEPPDTSQEPKPVRRIEGPAGLVIDLPLLTTGDGVP